MDLASLTGAVMCGGWAVNVSITPGELKWSPAEGEDGSARPTKKKDLLATTGSIDLNDLAVAKRDGADSKSFKIHWVKRKGKDNKLFSLQQTKFTATDENQCAEWTNQIHQNIEKLSCKRPKRLLIIINPQSGRKKAKQMYMQHAAPLFDLSGVETTIILTEKKSHATEMLQEYDFTTIDGIVCIGGDGTFRECVNGLLLRGMKDAGKDTSDKEAALEAPDVRIGSMAGGSGNGITDILYGTLDFVTATLHIILGHSEPILDVSSVFCDHQFMGYSFLLMGVGTCSEMIYDSETNRRFQFLGPARYLISAVKGVFSRRPVALDVDYKQDQEKGDPANKDDGNIEAKDEEHEEGACAQSLPRKITGKFMDAFLFPFKVHDGLSMTPGTWHLYAIKECGLKTQVGFYAKMATRKVELNDNIIHVDGNEFTIHLGEGAQPRENNQYVVDYDGEILFLPEPRFTLRVHKEVLQCFGVKSTLLKQS